MLVAAPHTGRRTAPSTPSTFPHRSPSSGTGSWLAQERLVLVAAPHTGEEESTFYSLHLPTPLTVFRYQ